MNGVFDPEGRPRTDAFSLSLAHRGAQSGPSIWYPQKQEPYPALRSSTEGIDRFLTKNTKVGIRRTQDGFDVYAPHGFDDIAAMIVRPNPGANFSAANYAAKAARWKTRWPELTVLPADAS